MKIYKKLAVCIVTLALFACMPFTASAYNNISYSTYAYNYDGKPVESPHAYITSKILKGSDLGISDFVNASDIALDEEDNIYVADTDNSRVVFMCIAPILLNLKRKLPNFP